MKEITINKFRSMVKGVGILAMVQGPSLRVTDEEGATLFHVIIASDEAFDLEAEASASDGRRGV